MPPRRREQSSVVQFGEMSGEWEASMDALGQEGPVDRLVAFLAPDHELISEQGDVRCGSPERRDTESEEDAREVPEGRRAGPSRWASWMPRSTSRIEVRYSSSLR